MSFELIRAITPYITFFLMLGLGLIGWLVRHWVEDTEAQFKEIKQDLLGRLDKIERSLEKMEASRLTEQRQLYEQFVTKEWFFNTEGRTESALGRVFQQLQSLHQKIPLQKNRVEKTG